MCNNGYIADVRRSRRPGNLEDALQMIVRDELGGEFIGRPLQGYLLRNIPVDGPLRQKPSYEDADTGEIRLARLGIALCGVEPGEHLFPRKPPDRKVLSQKVFKRAEYPTDRILIAIR